MERSELIQGYGLTMNHYQLLLLFCVLTPVAWAQAPETQDSARQVDAPQQRRAALRLALKEPRSPDTRANGQGPDSVSSERQLSDQDRANLRQQLRQQRPSEPLPRP
jgi:hypothetical protein